MTPLPHGFREGHQGDLACPHRDISCCPRCADHHPEIVDCLGVHYWIPDPVERQTFFQAVNTLDQQASKVMKG